MERLEVTRPGLVECRVCGGRGYVAEYHNETNDCRACEGTGTTAGRIPLPLEELCESMDELMHGKPIRASSGLIILDAYTRWRDANTTRK